MQETHSKRDKHLTARIDLVVHKGSSGCIRSKGEYLAQARRNIDLGPLLRRVLYAVRGCLEGNRQMVGVGVRAIAVGGGTVEETGC